MKEGMSREGSIVKKEVVSGCYRDQHLKITEKIILTLSGIFGYISYNILHNRQGSHECFSKTLTVCMR